MHLNQYEIYEFDITNAIKGDELPENTIKGIVISPNEMNDVLKTVLVAPLANCKNCAETPTTFKIDEIYKVRLDQISSIPKKRLLGHVGKISSHQAKKIKQVINEMLVK